MQKAKAASPTRLLIYRLTGLMFSDVRLAAVVGLHERERVGIEKRRDAQEAE